MELFITSVTALICAVIYLLQTISVIKVRRSERIVYGDGENKMMLKRIRGHGNSAEQMPIFLILLGLVELSGQISTVILLCLALMFVIGRIAHGLYFLDIGIHFRARMLGMLLTLLGQIAMILVLAYTLLA